MYSLSEKLMDDIIDETISKTIDLKERAKEIGILDKNIDPTMMNIDDMVRNLNKK